MIKPHSINGAGHSNLPENNARKVKHDRFWKIMRRSCFFRKQKHVKNTHCASESILTQEFNDVKNFICIFKALNLILLSLHTTLHLSFVLSIWSNYFWLFQQLSYNDLLTINATPQLFWPKLIEIYNRQICCRNRRVSLSRLMQAI